MSADEATTRLKEELIDDEYSFVEIQDLNLRQAEQLLARQGASYSLKTLERAVLGVKRIALKKQKENILRDCLKEFSFSREAAGLRRLESDFFTFDLSSPIIVEELSKKYLKKMQSAFRWFERNAERKSFPDKVLTEIERHFRVHSICNIIDLSIHRCEFEFSDNFIRGLKKIRLIGSKYASIFDKNLALIDIGIKLREDLTKFPSDYISQVYFGRQVLSKIYDIVGQDTLFRNWMNKFSNDGLIEQIKVGGRFQFRSKCIGEI